MVSKWKAQENDTEVSLQLSSRQTKRLKARAMELAEEHDLPWDELVAFAEVRPKLILGHMFTLDSLQLGNVTLMLLDIKADFLKYSPSSWKNAITIAKEKIESKNFEVGQFAWSFQSETTGRQEPLQEAPYMLSSITELDCICCRHAGACDGMFLLKSVLISN